MPRTFNICGTRWHPQKTRALFGDRGLSAPLGPVTCVAKCHHDRPPQRFLGQRPAQWSDDYPKPRPVGRSLRDIGLVKSIAYPAKSRSSFSRRPGTRKRFSFRSGADPHDLPHRSLTTGTGNPASPKAATHARCHRSVSGRGQFGQSEARPVPHPSDLHVSCLGPDGVSLTMEFP